WLQVTPREHGLEAIAHHAAQPDELNAMPDKFARLAQRRRRNPDSGQQIAAEQEREALGVDPVVLETGGGDGLRLLGIREHRPMAELLQEIDEPPPRPRRFDRDGRMRRELSEEFLKPRALITKPPLPDFAVVGQNRDLRTAFVEIDTDVYHLRGLLSQR